MNVSGTFDWGKHCFICGEEATAEKERKKRQEIRRKICFVESIEFTINILHELSYLKDDFHREVYKRLCDPRDLISLRAKYHVDFYKNVICEYEQEIKTPQKSYSNKMDQAMEEIFEFMLSSEECQFTNTQFKEVVQFSHVIPSDNTIKQC